MTCLTVYVYGDYIAYIPMYVYSVLYAYPQNYYVRVFSPQSLTKRVSSSLDLVREQVGNSFDVIENFSLSPEADNTKHARWLLGLEHFCGFDYIYFGDVDFIVVRENPDLLTVHLDNCNKTGLPYSNTIRWNTLPDRLSGLHFVIKYDYFRVMQNVIEKYRDVPSSYANNEELLKAMVEEVLSFPDKEDSIRPTHGLHLGVLRISHSIPDKWQKYDKSIFREPFYNELSERSPSYIRLIYKRAQRIMLNGT